MLVLISQFGCNARLRDGVVGEVLCVLLTGRRKKAKGRLLPCDGRSFAFAGAGVFVSLLFHSEQLSRMSCTNLDSCRLQLCMWLVCGPCPVASLSEPTPRRSTNVGPCVIGAVAAFAKIMTLAVATPL